MIDTQYLQYFAAGIFYEMVDGVRKPCEVKDVLFSAAAATNNQSVIAAVTGKKIVVLHGTMRSANVQGTVSFKSASGGTNKKAYTIPVVTAATPNVEILPVPWGAFRTNTGEGLFVDTTGADPITISLTYIEVTP